MIKQRIIATKISITRKGEVKFFQVKIPFDAKIITGIETGMRLQSFEDPGRPIGYANSLIGELKLQGSDDSNIFYATNVSDYSVGERLDKVRVVDFIEENVWTHGYKRELEQVLVDGNTTVLAGIYKDKIGKILNVNVSYDVFLYVWYKFKAKKNDDQSCS